MNHFRYHPNPLMCLIIQWLVLCLLFLCPTYSISVKVPIKLHIIKNKIGVKKDRTDKNKDM